jgi:acid phosphatase
MINTETDFFNAPDTHGSYDLDVGPFGSKRQQLDWLNADLASVDRSVTPWLIVAGHRPWYSTGGSDNQCFACQNAFEATIYKYGADLVLFGHVHNSQRFTPMYNNETDPAGLDNPQYPMYIIAGGAGNIEGLLPVGKNLTGNQFAYAKSQSYARLECMSRHELGVKFFKSDGNDLLDSSVLYKKHDVDFVRNF